MSSVETTYDAVLFTEAHAKGRSHVARIHAALDLVEPFLGGQGRFRDVGGGRFLASPADDLNATLLYPHGHAKALQPRYDWEDGPDGLKLGRLKPDEVTE